MYVKLKYDLDEIITGRGVRVGEDIEETSFLAYYDGELITEEEGERREEEEKSSVFRFFFEYKGEGLW